MFIDAMSVHSQLECSQNHKILFFTTMVNLAVFVTIAIWAFNRQKFFQLIN